MKNIILIFTAALLMSISSFGQDSEIYKTHEIYWLGIDYNHCYFITSYDFPSPSELYNRLGAWNVLIFNERDKYLDKSFPNKHITIASNFINQLNTDVNIKSQIVDDLSKTNHLTETDIPDIVKKYNIPSDLTGIGLILIAESYSKPDEEGYYYIAFIDLKSKKVLATEKMSGKVGGFSFRNYWARTYYNVLKQVGKRY
jgi:hypothetical protein